MSTAEERRKTTDRQNRERYEKKRRQTREELRKSWIPFLDDLSLGREINVQKFKDIFLRTSFYFKEYCATEAIDRDDLFLLCFLTTVVDAKTLMDVDPKGCTFAEADACYALADFLQSRICLGGTDSLFGDYEENVFRTNIYPACPVIQLDFNHFESTWDELVKFIKDLNYPDEYWDD